MSGLIPPTMDEADGSLPIDARPEPAMGAPKSANAGAVRSGLRVLVCGGRDYNDSRELYQALDRHWHRTALNGLVVIQGGATGADQLAIQWCKRLGVAFETFPAGWRTHGKAAGPIRNQRMIDEGKPDLVVAFKGGRGTADMVRRAIAAGLPVIDYRDGKPS